MVAKALSKSDYGSVNDNLSKEEAIEIRELGKESTEFIVVNKDIPVNDSDQTIFNYGPQFGPAFQPKEEVIIPLRVYELTQYNLATRWERLVQNYLNQVNQKTVSPFEACVIQPALNAMAASIGGLGLIGEAAKAKKRKRTSRDESYTRYKEKREQSQATEVFEYSRAVISFYEKLSSRLKTKTFMVKFRMLLSIYSFMFMPEWDDNDGENFVFNNEKTSFLYNARKLKWSKFKSEVKALEDGQIADGVFNTMFKLTDTVVADDNPENPKFQYDNTPKIVEDPQPMSILWYYLEEWLIKYAKENRPKRDEIDVPLSTIDDNDGLIKLITRSTGLVSNEGGYIPDYLYFINENIDFVTVIQQPKSVKKPNTGLLF